MAARSSILAGECPGQRSLADYSPRGCKESDMTERLTPHFIHRNHYFFFTSLLSVFSERDHIKLFPLVFTGFYISKVAVNVSWVKRWTSV